LRVAQALSSKRIKTAGNVEDLIEKTLTDLAFADARFRITVLQDSTRKGNTASTPAALTG